MFLVDGEPDGIKMLNLGGWNGTGLMFPRNKLKEAGLDFGYETMIFELVPKFEYDATCFESYKKGSKWLFGIKSKLIRGLKYKPDFVNVDDGWIIECKGHPNESFPIRWKLFKHYLKENDYNIHLYMPKNRAHVDQCVANLLETVYGRKTILQGAKNK